MGKVARAKVGSRNQELGSLRQWQAVEREGNQNERGREKRGKGRLRVGERNGVRKTELTFPRLFLLAGFAGSQLPLLPLTAIPYRNVNK